MILNTLVLVAILSANTIDGKKCKAKSAKSIDESILSNDCTTMPQLSCQMKNQNNNVLQCKMSSAPKNSTVFALSTSQNDLVMNTDQLGFTSSNWNIPQSITLNPIYDSPRFKNSTSISFDYTANGSGEGFDGCSGSYIGKRSVDTFKEAGKCNMWGDPHVTTFASSYKAPKLRDGESINVPIHHLGVHYAVKSNLGLTVQMNYGKCIHVSDDPFQASCVIGVYVAYKDQFISLDMPKNLKNGELVVKKSNNTDLMKFESNKDVVYSIKTKDGIDGGFGSSVVVTMNTFDIKFADGNPTVRSYYFDAEIKLSPIHYQQVQGHCNVYDFSDDVYNKRNHLLFAGDKMFKAPFSDEDTNAVSIMDWTLAFEVPASENGFNKGKISKRSDNTESNDSIYTPSTNSSTSDYVFMKLQNNMTIEEAMHLCRTCVGLESTDLELISQSGMMSCVSDAMMTGSNLFCASHSRVITSNLIEVAKSNITLSVESAQVLNLFVQKVAAVDCGTHGTKSDGVCHCSQGFSGIDCSIPIHSSMMLQSDGTMITSSAFTTSASLMLLGIVLMMQL